jgi:hypothetical protein
MSSLEADKEISATPAPKRYWCSVIGIVSNYTDWVSAASAAEARQIYADKRGCHAAWVEVRAA